MNYESRDQIEEKYRWDLSSMYESDEAFEQALVDLKTYPEQLASYRGNFAVRIRATCISEAGRPCYA